MATIIAVALFTTGGLTAGERTYASTTHYELNIPRQPLDTALKDLAQQTGLQVGRFSDAVKGDTLVGPVTGNYSAGQALETLLAPTKLTYRTLNDRAIIVLRPEDVAQLPETNTQSASGGTTGARVAEGGSGKDSNSNGDEKNSFWSRLRLAQTNQGSAQGDTSVGSSASRLNKSPPTSSDVGEHGVGLEEVIVTAQKREERLQDVPMSIVALSSDDLAKQNITNIDDLQYVVPGLQLHKQAQTNAIYLRGVANIAGNSPLVGIYVDDADATAATAQLDVSTFDLQRIEILRGPQGTLYGQGSMGGTIRFITNAPSFDAFMMKADVSALFTEKGAPSQRIESAINVPLNDSLAVRIAGRFDHEGGWINQPAANLKDINQHDIADVRTKILWQPSQQFTATATAEIHRNDGVMDNGEDSNGNYTQPFGQTTQRRISNDFDVFNLALTYDFGAAKLLSTTSYVDQDNVAYNYGWFGQFNPPPSAPYGIITPKTETSSRNLSEEIRLTSTGNGAWEWTIGAFARDFHSRFSVSDFYFDLGSTLPALLPAPAPTLGTSKSWALFADTNYKFFERFTVGAGMRGFRDDQTAPGQSAQFHSVDPRFYVDFKALEGINLYGSAAKGFRSGGFNAVGEQPYGPEQVWTYELGAKIGVLDHRLSVNADIFYSDYSQYQTAAALPPSFTLITGNVGGAEIKGVEATLSWIPAYAWTVDVNADYIDAHVTSIGQARPSTITLLPGDKLNYVPEYQATFSVERHFTWAQRSAYVRAGYNLQGPTNLTVENGGPWYRSHSETIGLLGLKSGIDWSESLSMSIFVENLLNDRGYTEPDIIEDAANRAQPRTFGVNFGVKF